MDVLDIVLKYLEDNGYDGLFNADLECGCERTDLAPCSSIDEHCGAGYKFPCDCGDHDYHIGSAEERDRVLKGLSDDDP